ncbi:MAG TPA: triphosphoribosyl-dephospho-CoA synthase [Methylibium sp.]|uniref:triphosphoribosyl-dephospho-CoA synthase n=1 Tax=Methylibium sp. TaxID=2067992 RepID=UPI002DBE9341|nr:triphosphoribosyl-dephospho-CoA synthase [Methylibium sp.]HEU4459807.1 triphosphoribosyl-dephospho-CoA synthase [Methylibium sp.]
MTAVDPATAFVRACALDVAVRKPGNVSAASPGHGMDAQLFLDSAEAARAGLFARGARVGARIEAAMRATLDVAGCNTNLGIVLLCAPLAAAIERCPAPCDAQALRRTLQGVLGALDVEDAGGAFRAIAAARPAGLGQSAQQDVNAPPSLSLLEAMRLAAGRDRVARAYATNFDEVFGTGLSSLAADGGLHDTATATRAVQRLYLRLLCADLDSHIVRKHGVAAAQAVTDEAGPWLARLEGGELVDAAPAFAQWDASLKQRRLNPGTCADLTVATLFLAGALGIELGTGLSQGDS